MFEKRLIVIAAHILRQYEQQLQNDNGALQWFVKGAATCKISFEGNINPFHNLEIHIQHVFRDWSKPWAKHVM